VLKNRFKQNEGNIMKKREIRIPPLPQTTALSEKSESAFFCFWRQGSTKNSTLFGSSRLLGGILKIS